MIEKPKTVCVECPNHMYADPHSINKEIWYNHICKVIEKKPQQYDPVTGDLEEQRHEYCRDVNDGNCPHHPVNANVFK